jgi:hypothetical protein
MYVAEYGDKTLDLAQGLHVLLLSQKLHIYIMFLLLMKESYKAPRWHGVHTLTKIMTYCLEY